MLQNPKLTAVAIAVAASLCAPLAAQAQSHVTVYGKLYPQLVHADISGATGTGAAVSRLSATPVGGADYTTNTMDSPNSRLGFRGSEDLGSGLKAIFQLEMGFGVDTGLNTSSTALFSRDTWVGLQGGFGTVRLGSMDTVYKNLGDTLSFLGISSGNFISTSNILSKPGIGSSSAASFHLRRANSIIYESPEFGGAQFLFDYSLGEVANDFSRGAVISTGVKYEAGPLYAAIAYERHNDLFGGSKNVPSALRNDTNLLANSRDSAVRATVQYKFGKQTRAEVNVAQLKYEETGGGVGKFRNYEHMAWSLAVEHKITPAVTLVASYGLGTDGTCSITGQACSTNGLEGKMFNVGAGYYLSKRTMLYAIGSYMGNGVSATYSNLNDGKPLPGQDLKIVALGLSHSF
ncbi:porin [Massilia sp. TWR1-2-2]|uniref:porin n=1 Tax=Massilia sp. TWR1-2-2 TaxID=2804584 RepID=UPI003CF9DFEF